MISDSESAYQIQGNGSRVTLFMEYFRYFSFQSKFFRGVFSMSAISNREDLRVARYISTKEPNLQPKRAKKIPKLNLGAKFRSQTILCSIHPFPYCPVSIKIQKYLPNCLDLQIYVVSSLNPFCRFSKKLCCVFFSSLFSLLKLSTKLSKRWSQNNNEITYTFFPFPSWKRAKIVNTRGLNNS